jgi:catechol 2,3-dioxygenase-like lactoylglutathione lyase family enzyme
MDTITNFRIKKMSPQLLVTDLDRSVEFYTKKLGFDVDFRYDDFYSGIVKDGYSIHLKSGKSSIHQQRDNEDLHILFSVEGIERLYSDFLSKSVEMVQPLRQMPYGGEFYVADPDGNVIAFVET